MKLEDKLYLNRFKPDSKSHLVIKNPEVCLEECKEKWCTYFCPAGVYEWDEEERRILVGYEGCVECGTCRVGCPYRNIDWRYPRGGFGVTYKHG